MDKIISSLLFASGIYSANGKDINIHLHSHPEYPSLRSITDTLDYFNIRNVAAKVDKSSLSKLPKLFLAHLQSDMQLDFALVHRLKNKIKLTWQDGNSIQVSQEEFVEKWDGTLLAVEKDESHNDSFIQKFKNSNILIILSTISILILLWIYSISKVSFCFSALSLIGLFVSYLIQKESFGIGDSSVAKVCSVINKNSDGCETVIKSDKNKIFGISLSDISLVYFTFLLLFSSLEGIDNSLLYVISGLSLITVIYTLYIQLFELKTWCLLCLFVSIILISQFLILQFFIEQTTYHLSFLSIGSTILLFVISFWILLKSIWQNAIELSDTKAKLLGFKKESEFFFQALNKNKILLSNEINEEYSISFGSKSPTINLIAITNPTCGYCNKAFESYDYLLTKYPDDIRIDFVFNVSKDLENDSNIVASKIIEIYQHDKLKAYNAMGEWFNNREVEDWIAKFGNPNRNNEYLQHCILSHTEWSNINNILYIPETILGNSIFPKSHYEIEDLEFFIETIKESGHTNYDLPSLITEATR